MVWGGSLNKDGSDYIRKLREADKVLIFLETMKKELNQQDQLYVSKTIEIIIDNVSKLLDKKD
ncbi:MAG: hypothetical protein ACFFHD_01455 [Promethearchaeota archaeon]